MRRGARSVLSDLRHSGSAKALFPRSTGSALDAVLLNTAGGITGGDQFAYRAAAGPNAWVRISTQAAERGYRAAPGEIGRVDVSLAADAGATLHWLPQETILFDGAALERRYEATLDASARLLAVEGVVFGRAAMGERVVDLRLNDQWRVRRDGRLVFADALRIDGDADQLLTRTAVAGGARALSLMLYVGDDARQKLEPLRAVLPETAGASCPRPDVLVARILAEDGYRMRSTLIAALSLLGDAPPPKMWMF